MAKKSNSDGGIAAQARSDEQARQERIRAGTARINQIFDGGPAPVKPAAAAPASDGSFLGNVISSVAPQFIPTMSGGTAPAPASTAEPTSPTGTMGVPGQPSSLSGLPDGTGGPGQFTDAFYEGRKKAYQDYAMPQLDKQFNTAKKQLTFDLARSGTLNSSSRAAKDAELSSLYDTNKRAVDDTALAQSNEARNSVESARAELIAMLNSSGDAEGTANSALSRAAALSRPAAFSPLSQMFSTFTGALGTQAAAERAQAYSGGAYKAPFNTGLFAPSSSAVKVS